MARHASAPPRSLDAGCPTDVCCLLLGEMRKLCTRVPQTTGREEILPEMLRDVSDVFVRPFSVAPESLC